MKMRSLVIFLFTSTLFASNSVSAFDQNDKEIKALLGFISDATHFEGMFYSLYDYCAPYAPTVVLKLSEWYWLRDNKSLPTDRESAVEKFKKILEQTGATQETLEEASSMMKQLINTSKKNDILYKDITLQDEKLTLCSKRLGFINSESMSFKNIAPASYEYWKSNF